MSNVQEALISAIELIQCFEAKLTNSQTAHSLPSEKVKRKLRDAISEIEKYEPVGELILDPAFLPALKSPLVNWKINLVDLEVGTKFFTSPQPREGWVLTPNKITDEMEDCWRGYYDGSFDADECYEKMLTKIPTDTKE